MSDFSPEEAQERFEAVMKRCLKAKPISDKQLKAKYGSVSMNDLPSLIDRAVEEDRAEKAKRISDNLSTPKKRGAE